MAAVFSVVDNDHVDNVCSFKVDLPPTVLVVLSVGYRPVIVVKIRFVSVCSR